MLRRSYIQLLITAAVLIIVALLLPGAAGLGLIWSIPAFMGLLSTTSLMQDEHSRWDQFSLALPFSRSMHVNVKYLLTVLAVLSAAAVNALPAYLLMQRTEDGIRGFVLYLISMTAMGFVLPSLILPFYFRLGAARAQTVFTLGAALAALTVFAIGMIRRHLPTAETAGDSASWLEFLTADDFSVLTYAAIVLGGLVLLFGSSWLISMKLFAHRDF